MDGPIERLTFVYDADGTLAGELRYWFGTLFGAAHCSLCDVTHTRWGRRREFRGCEQRLGLPIEYLHRNDLDSAVRASVGPMPVVLGHSGDRIEVLLDATQLSLLAGDVPAFEAALHDAIAARR